MVWPFKAKAPPDNRFYLELDGKKLPVLEQFRDACIGIDGDSDRHLDAHELTYLADDAGLKVDPKRYVDEQIHWMTGTPIKELNDYPGVDQVAQQLADLAAAHPGLAERVSLGKTHEGRDIWALRLGAHPAGEKPAVVISGGTHAREYPSVAIPLEVAKKALEDSALLDRGEVWIVPLVNPDGYEYSRNTDGSWRKNRNPVAGVDLNRNFYDAAHPELYRHEKDNKGGSDSPESRTYRGPAGGSEPEVQAMQALWQRPNVIAALDNHCCGEMVLYAVGDEKSAQIAKEINAGLGYQVMSADDLYATTGTSNSVQAAHGQVALTIESGLSFQPPAAALHDIESRVVPAEIRFLERMLR